MATEKQAYRVVRRENELEIRYYPSAVVAAVPVAGGYDAMRYGGFQELAGYIFGNNTAGAKIAMTAPVIMELDPAEQAAGTMAFVMPADFDYDRRPQPRSSAVDVRRTAPVYAAVVTFGGFGSRRDMEAHRDRLFALLDARGLRYDPRAEYRMFDPPFRLLGRRNEVAVRLLDFAE